MNFLLIAVLSASTGSLVSGNTRGYQSSIMQHFASLEECKLGSAQLMETYVAGNIQASAPERGQIRCVNLKTGEVTITFGSR
jgi:hypothetical protein